MSVPDHDKHPNQDEYFYYDEYIDLKGYLDNDDQLANFWINNNSPPCFYEYSSYQVPPSVLHRCLINCACDIPMTPAGLRCSTRDH